MRYKQCGSLTRLGLWLNGCRSEIGRYEGISYLMNALPADDPRYSTSQTVAGLLRFKMSSTTPRQSLMSVLQKKKGKYEDMLPGPPKWGMVVSNENQIAQTNVEL